MPAGITDAAVHTTYCCPWLRHFANILTQFGTSGAPRWSPKRRKIELAPWRRSGSDSESQYHPHIKKTGAALGRFRDQLFTKIQTNQAEKPLLRKKESLKPDGSQNDAQM